MQPTFQYLLLSRDVIGDIDTREASAIRIFDHIFIPKDQSSVVYSFHVLGRINLNATGIVSSEIKLKIKDPSGGEVSTISMDGKDINAEVGLNIHGIFSLVIFKQEGKYSIETQVNINGGEFMKVEPPLIFWVDKIVV